MIKIQWLNSATFECNAFMAIWCEMHISFWFSASLSLWYVQYIFIDIFTWLNLNMRIMILGMGKHI